MAASHLPQVLAPHLPPASWIIRGEASGRVRQLFDIVTGASADLATHTLQEDERGVRHLVLDVPATDVDYPLPPFALLPMETYEQLFRNGDFVPHMETSLGCSHRCTFCGVHYPAARGAYRRCGPLGPIHHPGRGQGCGGGVVEGRFPAPRRGPG